MLVKGNDVIGLNIYTIHEGKKLATIHDLIYDPRRQKVLAFQTEAGGLFSEPLVIPIENIQSIGKDAVMVESQDVLQPVSEVSEFVSDLAKSDKYLTQTRVMTESGSDLGVVNDIYFDSQTGDVQQLEVSQGLEDLATGRKSVNISDIVTIGEDATIVRSYTESKMEQQAQERGAQGAVNDFIGNVQDKAPEWRERAENKIEEIKANPKVQKFARKVKESAQKTSHDVQNYHKPVAYADSKRSEGFYIESTTTRIKKDKRR